MTKFVLHGGFDAGQAPIQEDDAFFTEILKDTSGNVNILLVYFAERTEMVELRTTQDKDSFNKNKGSQNLVFKVTSEETFIKDCEWADVIYLHGGRTARLMAVLEKYKNLNEVFLNKTIAGDSAGVNALGQVFFSPTSKTIGAGLKILPFKTVVHYKEGTPNPLADVEPNLETLFLREYETKVFHQ
ncbi:Type 1 glutamine amidotransferase-like domain-containing protein [Candidatus Nomurabacteria bacterium]|nr:Type 1 glutamine amidotransferase-like domain-containing protein [Candidatus Nomurabacteria bacterium]